MHHNIPKAALFISLLMLASITYAQKPRARDIGIPFTGTPGKYKSGANGHNRGSRHASQHSAPKP